MKLWAHGTTFCVTRYCEQQVGTACPPLQCGVLYVEHSNFKTVTMVSKMQTLLHHCGYSVYSVRSCPLRGLLFKKGLLPNNKQCSPEAPAAGVFTSYSCIKHQLLSLDKSTGNYALVSLK